MVLGLKLKLRDMFVKIVLTIARWIIEHLDGEGDEPQPLE